MSYHPSSLIHQSRMPKMIEKIQEFDRPINMLEIGTWYGVGSFRLWLEFLPSGSTITVMDLWRNVSNDGLPSLQVELDTNPEEVIFNGWKSTIEQVRQFESSKIKDIVINVIRADSNPFLESFRDKLFDFIYIDGDHGYSGCYYDAVQAKRLIKDNGIICGDDLDITGTPENIDEIRIKAQQSRSAPYHPGVSAAVYDAFGVVNNYSGFWWVDVKDGKFVV